MQGADATILSRSDNIAGDFARDGARVARLIWDDDIGVRALEDPRHPEFANSVIDELTQMLASAPGVLQRVMTGAASAAEDLNVEPFQGLIEVVQNADDLLASEVRLAFRDHGGGRQLLIVHDGRPVTCHHILSMTLPYLTTKAEDAEQKGRFGIGLKTLRRISTRLTVHCWPYHFSAEGLSLERTIPEAPLASFYDPVRDTLIVLDLLPDFGEDAFGQWFEEWDEDGLLFLNRVRRFRWCEISGETIAEKAISVGDWQPAHFESLNEDVTGIRHCKAFGRSDAWAVYRADVRIPEGMERAHKAKVKLTAISVAVSEQAASGGLFVAFRTRVPTNLTVAIDAQFDPSTAREALIQNAWNTWLIERCADVLIEVAAGLLMTDPAAAWRVIPLESENVGPETAQWPRSAFSNAFGRVRGELAQKARLLIGGDLVPLSDAAYEHEFLAGLLESFDIELLVATKRAVVNEARDGQDRWRDVLNQLQVAQVVGTAELLDGFSRFAFNHKNACWWVDAADRITGHHPNSEEILGVPCWLSEDCRPIPCHPIGSSSRPVVFGGTCSEFSKKWQLLDCLHEAYGTELGKQALTWLRGNAAFSEAPDAEIDLAAFGEAYRQTPVEITDEDLRELRDRFDGLSDLRAETLGCRVGTAILLDGFTYKSRGKVGKKVSPANAYLPRTLDSEHPYWSEAADKVPGIDWLSPSYEDKLKTGAHRAARKRADGTMLRGARKFLLLLGAECAPRIIKLPGRVESGTTRTRQLREASAEFVRFDYSSPDMNRVFDALSRCSKRQRKSRSPALLRALSRHWVRLYADKQTVMAVHQARVYQYDTRAITASWLCRLLEVAWVAVGDGDLVEPGHAVIKSPQTQSLYTEFACGLDEEIVSSELAVALNLITEVRVSDLVAHLRQVRDAAESFDIEAILAIYRILAKLCPGETNSHSRVGNLLVRDLREYFSEGTGLICIGPGEWRRPEQLFSGKDIFHQSHRFVPASGAYQDLWRALDIRKPDLGDCIRYCKELARQPYSVSAEATLIDVYRYMESLASQVERQRLRRLPVVCFDKWTSERPIYFIEDRELRAELSHALPGKRFWTPPCDVRNLSKLTKSLNLALLTPDLTVAEDMQLAQDIGESVRARFQRGVDHLSNELARNDPSIREKLGMLWEEFRNIPLFVYEEPMRVLVCTPELGASSIPIRMEALLSDNPRTLHLSRGAFAQRNKGGRIVASLFPPDVQRRIEAEWVASWLASEDAPVERMHFASDEELAGALAQLARKTESIHPGKIKVSTPASRMPSASPRMLKTFQGGINAVTIHHGASPKPITEKQRKTLLTPPPAPSPAPAAVAPVTPPGYTNAEIEQRGWEVLTHVLNTTDLPELMDFRKRRCVGADGTIDWKTFVEMKATGRAPQTSIEMSNPEYERALERGLDFILALVSGLEEDELTEVRMVLDPGHRATVQPIRGVRLVGLADAPAVVVQFDNDQREEN